MNDPSDRIFFLYRFKFRNIPEYHIRINLRPGTLDMETFPRSNLPAWTKLECHQCQNCPLNIKSHPHCPVAANLVDIIQFLFLTNMDEELDITIETEERSYYKQTLLKEAASSLIGIVMVTSGCPVLDKLRPQVRFHLPFPAVEETLYRSLSMYLMAQYFRFRKDQKPDWDMKGLRNIYEEIFKVNASFSERLKELEKSGTSVEAILNLDCFAYYSNLSLSGKAFSDIECLYGNYIKDL